MIKKIKSVKVAKRLRLHKKIRSQVNGTAERPRLCVFKSNIYIYAQLVNDDTATTICAASDILKNVNPTSKMTKMECAVNVGKTIAELAKKAGVNTVVFDRAGFKYGGRVKALADSARESGLIF